MSLKKNIPAKVLLVISIIFMVMGSSILVSQFLFASWADDMIVKEILEEPSIAKSPLNFKDNDQVKILDSKIEIRKKSWGPFLGSRWRAFGVITIFAGLLGILLYIKMRRRKEKG